MLPKWNLIQFKWQCSIVGYAKEGRYKINGGCEIGQSKQIKPAPQHVNEADAIENSKQDWHHGAGSSGGLTKCVNIRREGFGAWQFANVLINPPSRYRYPHQNPTNLAL